MQGRKRETGGYLHHGGVAGPTREETHWWGRATSLRHEFRLQWILMPQG